MKKYIFITTSLKGGGAERNMINVINSIDVKLFDIILIVCRVENDFEQFIKPGIKIINLRKNNIRKAIVPVFNIIAKEKPNLIFTSAEHLTIAIVCFKFLFRGKFLNIARLPTLPSNNLATNLKEKFIKAISQYFYRRVDYIIAQSKEMRNDAISLFGLKDINKIIIIPNLVDVRVIRFLAEAESANFNNFNYNLIAAGTLYSVKGFDLLIKAMPLILQSIPNAKLYIFGNEGNEFGYKDFLQSLIIELKLEQSIFIGEFKKNPYPYFKKADLFILPSRKEGFPNVVIESLTLGTKVLATDCVNFDGIIVPGVNGKVIQKENIEELAKGVIECKGLGTFDYLPKNFNYTIWFDNILKVKQY